MTCKRGRRYYKINETAIADKDNILTTLSLYLSLVVLQLGGIAFALPPVL